jgi:hypothetical protein
MQKTTNDYGQIKDGIKYVVQDGLVTSDLTKVETFKHEVDLLR